MVTLELMNKVFPNNKNIDKWVKEFEVLPTYDIDTNIRVAAFLSQTGHESAGFTAVSENLNYSANALMSVFKKYFPTQELAVAYARKPTMIANRVYANRMGNGSETSGDGWKYRGRGILQVTGKDNYKRFSEWVKNPSIIDNPDLVAEPQYATLSAIWFWDINKLNAIADTGNIQLLTKRINGGTNGIEHRTELYHNIMKHIGE